MDRNWPGFLGSFFLATVAEKMGPHPAKCCRNDSSVVPKFKFFTNSVVSGSGSSPSGTSSAVFGVGSSRKPSLPFLDASVSFVSPLYVEVLS